MGLMVVSSDTFTGGRCWKFSSVFGAALLVFGTKWMRPLFVKLYERFSVWPLFSYLLVLSVKNRTAFLRDPATCSMVSSSMHEASTTPAYGKRLSITCAYIRKRTGEIGDPCGSSEVWGLGVSMVL